MLHLHSDCVGVLGRIASMLGGTWDDKQEAEDGSAPLWRAVAASVRQLRDVGCGLRLIWVPGHTDGVTDEHVVQDLCDSLCPGLRRADWPLLSQSNLLFEDDVVAALCSPEAGRCTDDI